MNDSKAIGSQKGLYTQDSIPGVPQDSPLPQPHYCLNNLAMGLVDLVAFLTFLSLTNCWTLQTLINLPPGGNASVWRYNTQQETFPIQTSAIYCSNLSLFLLVSPFLSVRSSIHFTPMLHPPPCTLGKEEFAHKEGKPLLLHYSPFPDLYPSPSCKEKFFSSYLDCSRRL